MLEALFRLFPIEMTIFPGVAILPAVIFAGFYIKRRDTISKFSRIATIFTISVWIIYGVFETGKYFWTKKFIIPPDQSYLDLIVPLLYLATIVGIIGLIDRVFKSLLILASLSISIAVIIEIWPEPKCGESRSYCAPCEQDAHAVVAALASYFSDTDNKRIPTIETLKYSADLSLHNVDPEPTIWPPERTNAYHYNTIKVTVYDNSGCCPRGSAYIQKGNVTPPPSFQRGYWEK